MVECAFVVLTDTSGSLDTATDATPSYPATSLNIQAWLQLSGAAFCWHSTSHTHNGHIRQDAAGPISTFL